MHLGVKVDILELLVVAYIVLILGKGVDIRFLNRAKDNVLSNRHRCQLPDIAIAPDKLSVVAYSILVE